MRSVTEKLVFDRLACVRSAFVRVMFEWEVFCQECNRWGVPRETGPESFQCRYCGSSLWETGWIPIKKK